MKNRKILIKSTFLLLFIASILLGCNKNPTDSWRTVSQIQKSGKIRIAVYQDKKPFCYKDENGIYRGYDIYFGNRIAQDLGVKVEYIPVTPNNRINYLNSGIVDLIIASFTRTPERLQLVDFALPYMKISIGILSREGNLFYHEQELDGKAIVVVKGTTAERYIEKNMPNVNLVKYDNYKEAFEEFQRGSGDAFSTDNTELLAWSLEHPGYKVTINSLGPQEAIAPAVQKGNSTLLSWLNAEIKSLAFEQFFHKAYEETLRPIFGKAADSNALVVEGGAL